MSIGKVKVVRIVTAPESVLYHLRNTLTQIDRDFDVMVVGTDVSQFAAEYPNITWIDIEIPRAISPLKDLMAVGRLSRLLLREKPQIVHSIMPKAGLVSAIAAFLANIPVRGHTFTGQVWAEKTGLSRYVFKLIDKLIVKVSTFALTDSPSQSRYLFENGIRFKSAPLPVLGLGSLAGVDFVKFDRKKLISSDARIQFRRKYNIGQDDQVFIFLGRKCKAKGIFELFQAFRQVNLHEPNTWLVLIGADETNGEVEKTISSMAECASRIINISFSRSVEESLVACDVLCLPSYREGFGSVVIEAAALGIPTIGSKIDGLVDSIQEDVTGVLVSPRSTMELCTAMLDLAKNRNKTESLGRAAYLRAIDNFDSKYVYKKMADFYLECLNRIGTKRREEV
ncbi:MAG: glycosyltransferase [Bdellovibrio sp.]